MQARSLRPQHGFCEGKSRLFLGKGDIERAKDTSRKMRVFTVILGASFGLLMVCMAPFYPHFYNVSNEIRSMATGLIIVFGLIMPDTLTC